LRTAGGIEAKERTISFTLGQNSAQVDNRNVEIKQMPLLISGATFVPIRFVSEKLNANVAFNAGNISITRGNRTIALRIGQTAATVNGEARQLSRAAFTQNGVTFVPLRFIAEAFNANVQFASGRITIRAPLR
jgi:internalin A